MLELLALFVLAAATAVAVDASRLDAHRGRLGGGLLDMGPAAWFFCVLLAWVISLPAYLVVRPRLRRADRAVSAAWTGPSSAAAPVAPGHHQGFAAPPLHAAAAGAPWAHPDAASAAAAATITATATGPSRAERLQQLRESRERGQIDEQELRAARRRILADPA